MVHTITVDFIRRTSSKDVEDCPIGRKNDGHRSLGFINQLPGAGLNYADLWRKKVLFDFQILFKLIELDYKC